MMLPAAAAARKVPNFEYHRRRDGLVFFKLIGSEGGSVARLTPPVATYYDRILPCRKQSNTLFSGHFPLLLVVDDTYVKKRL